MAIIPALLATILIFMDQHISCVIINRKDNKLKVKFLIHYCENNSLRVVLYHTIGHRVVLSINGL